MPIDVQLILTTIEGAVVAAVNDTGIKAYDRARKDVPVRKVFRYGRTASGLRIQGRQETRALSTAEGQAESGIRKRLGLPSAFPTTASGRRERGSQPLVQTALFPGNYRTRNRANDYRSMDRREARQIGSKNYLVNYRVSELQGSQRKEPVRRPVPDPDRERDLSARGKYELQRRTTVSKLTGKVTRSAMTGSGQDQTLGGALRNSLHQSFASAGGRLIQTTISAGNEKVDYAKYVEFGTRQARAQPFLRPALAQAREDLPKQLHDQLGQYGIWKK